MLKWFPQEDVFHTRHKHHIIVVPVTEKYEIPDTPLKFRLLKHFEQEVVYMQKNMKPACKGCKFLCAYNEEHHVRLIFFPIMRKNPQSGIICPDIRAMRLMMWQLRHCALAHGKSIAFDRYSFFYWENEREIWTGSEERACLWRYVEDSIRECLSGNEFASVGIFEYKRPY